MVKKDSFGSVYTSMNPNRNKHNSVVDNNLLGLGRNQETSLHTLNLPSNHNIYGNSPRNTNNNKINGEKSPCSNKSNGR